MCISFLFIVGCSSVDFPLQTPVVCDAETTNNENFTFITNVEPFEFGGMLARTNEQARSGKFAVRTDSVNKKAFNFVIPHCNQGEYYKIHVWRKGETGKLIVEHTNRSRFFLTASHPIQTDSAGWEMLSADFIVPLGFFDDDLNLFVTASDSTSAVFDDLSIEKLQVATYTGNADNVLNVYINPELLSLFQAQEGYNDNKKTALEVILFYADTEAPAKMSILKKTDDTLHSSKPSIEISMQKGMSWNGLKEFTLFDPMNRALQREWVAHQIMQQEKIMTPRYGFVPVMFNGAYAGIFAYEEEISTDMLPAFEQPNAPLVRFKPENDLIINNLSALDVTSSNPKRINKDSLLRRQFLQSRNMLHLYANNKILATETFNIPLYAKYLALCDLLQAYQGLDIENQFYYYNPYNSLLWPVFGKGYSYNTRYEQHAPTLVMTHAIMRNQFKNTNNPLLNNLFADSVFQVYFINYIKRFTQKSYIDTLVNNLSIKENELISFLNTEYKNITNDHSALYKQTEILSRQILVFDRYKSDFSSSIKTTTPSVTNESQLIKAYTQSSQQGIDSVLVVNHSNSNIAILGTGRNPLNILHFIYPEKQLPYKTQGVASTTIVKQKTSDYLFYMADRQMNNYAVKISPWAAPIEQAARADAEFKINLYNEKSLQIRPDSSIVFKSGKNRINHTIVIPRGYKVYLNAGTTLDLINGAAIISFSPVFADGTPEQNVVITSVDGSGQGFHILEASAESQLNFVVFEKLRALDQKGWLLPAAVTLYNTRCSIYGATFKQMATHALQITQSYCNMQRVWFNNISGNAIQAEYCHVQIAGTRINQVSGNAIQTNRGGLELEKCNISGIGGNAIYANNADVLINTCKIEKISTALTIINGSRLTAQNIDINRSKYGIVIYSPDKRYPKSAVHIRNATMTAVDMFHLVEKNTQLLLNNDIIQGQAADVEQILTINK